MDAPRVAAEAADSTTTLQPATAPLAVHPGTDSPAALGDAPSTIFPTALLQEQASKLWYGFDLDRCLAQYSHWQGVEHIGEPIAPMVAKVKQYLAEGKRVKIFTARVWFNRADGFQEPAYCSPDDIVEWAQDRPGRTPDLKRWAESQLAKAAIHNWAYRVFGQVIEVTCEKDPWCLELWDDIARQVSPNQGEDMLKVLGDAWLLSEEQLAKASAFKTYVHERLDAASVDLHEEQNALNGCRIGARLDDVLRTSDYTAPDAEGLYPYTAVVVDQDGDNTQCFTYSAKNDKDAEENVFGEGADPDNFQVVAIHKGHNALVNSYDLNGF
jgi:hypothetical protein